MSNFKKSVLVAAVLSLSAFAANAADQGKGKVTLPVLSLKHLVQLLPKRLIRLLNWAKFLLHHWLTWALLNHVVSALVWRNVMWLR